MKLIVRNVLALSLVFVLVLAACQPATPAPTVTARPPATAVPPTTAAVTEATAEMTMEATDEMMDATDDMTMDATDEMTMDATDEMTMDATEEMAMDATDESSPVVMGMDATAEMMAPVAEETVEMATDEPTATEAPTDEPTATEVPTEEPTDEPTATTVPTAAPTEEPTIVPIPEVTVEATDEMMMDATAEMTMDATAEATEAAMMPEDMTDMTIAEIVMADENFSILLAAVVEAGLADALAGDGPLTVFAPTNEAFETLLDSMNMSAEDLLANEDLASILLYHVVAGTVPAETLITLIRTQSDNELEIKTLVENQVLLFTLDEDNNVIINGTVKVTVANIRASNGIIHVIDAVLMAPAGE